MQIILHFFVTKTESSQWHDSEYSGILIKRLIARTFIDWEQFLSNKKTEKSSESDIVILIVVVAYFFLSIDIYTVS